MQQYFKIKAKHPTAILLFRIGDFYETFGDDAVVTAQVLGIVLTSRNNGGSDIPLAGFPHHSVDTYLPRLIRAGHRVAICEQLEKPSKEKKIVKRGVTEIVTPGLAVDDKLLDHKTNNFLASLHFGKQDQMGMALFDISTGEFVFSQGSREYIDKLLQSFLPTEIILSKDQKKKFQEGYGERFYVFSIDEWVYTFDYTREKLINHFEVQNLKGFGVEDMQLAQIAGGAILHYLETTENKNLKHLTGIGRILPDRFVWLDRFTIRNLELIYSPHETGVPLINILDHTISPMGGRLLKKWVVLPLKSVEEIESRLEVVSFFTKEEETVDKLSKAIRQMGDLERLISKVPLGKINPREIVYLRRALMAIPEMQESLHSISVPMLEKVAKDLDPCPVLCEEVKQQIVEEPPVNLNKGGVIADGFNKELDELRDIMKNGRGKLVEIKEREIEKTGINSLKIGFNNVFGYFLEVTNKYKNDVPEEWIRKQTLTNCERYITDELKVLEDKILGAEGKVLEIEARLYEQFVYRLADFIPMVQRNAALIARVDCLMSFAKVANKHHYCRPVIDDSLVIDIKEGRHPVIEQQLPLGEAYVPNDVFLDNENQQVMMITGPNMSGKSALLRQVALISLMAQMGSFVPAKSARLGIVDKVFTRVGASDNISSGESTFMVEMNETASIMNNVSDRSLILLDEIGRGTSTYDGISIAWSIAEYLHDNGRSRPKTLFATHYHELNELAGKFDRIKNFNVSVKEINNKIIFLRKLAEGGSAHSFGIHVAKMAGMPKSIVARANSILLQLEQKHIDSEGNSENGIPHVATADTASLSAEAMQLSIFETVDVVAGKLKAELIDLEINSMTPIDCMMKLNELKKLLE